VKPRKPPNEMDLVDLMDDREEPQLTEEEVDALIREAQPTHDGNYELVPERVVALDKRKYDRDAAYMRFAQIAKSQKLVQINHKETPRHFIWECLYRIEKGEQDGE